MNEAAPVQSAAKEKEKEVEVIEPDSDDDMASLFGEDDDDAAVETVDDAVFEADMYEALDLALSQAD